MYWEKNMVWVAALNAKVLLAVSAAALILVAFAALPVERWGLRAQEPMDLARREEQGSPVATDRMALEKRDVRDDAMGTAGQGSSGTGFGQDLSRSAGEGTEGVTVGMGGEGDGKGAGSGQGPELGVAEVELGGGLVLRLEVPRTVRIGQQLEAVVVLANRGSGPVNFRFMTSHRFELLVLDGSGRVVRRWSEGKFFLQAIQSITLRPGEELRETLRLETDGLSAGSYTIVAQTTAQLTGDEVPFPLPGRTVPGRFWGRGATVEVTLVG
ncbi:MAG: BsuPI-related putative proteinase inhibitor [Nitrososphaerota archaeon]